MPHGREGADRSDPGSLSLPSGLTRGCTASRPAASMIWCRRWLLGRLKEPGQPALRRDRRTRAGLSSTADRRRLAIPLAGRDRRESARAGSHHLGRGDDRGWCQQRWPSRSAHASWQCISCATPSHTPARASAASSGQARRYMSLETLGTISDTLLSVCPLWQPDCAAHAARKHHSYTMGWDTIVPLKPQSSKPLVSRRGQSADGRLTIG
jgi:hypothetical protein